MTDARTTLALVVAPEAMCGSLLACIGSICAIWIVSSELNSGVYSSSTVVELLTGARLALPLVVAPEAMRGSLLVRIGSKFCNFI